MKKNLNLECLNNGKKDCAWRYQPSQSPLFITQTQYKFGFLLLSLFFGEVKGYLNAAWSRIEWYCCTVLPLATENFIDLNNTSTVGLIMGWSAKWCENLESTPWFPKELSILQFYTFRYLPDHLLIQSWGHSAIVPNICRIQGAVSPFLIHFLCSYPSGTGKIATWS